MIIYILLGVCLVSALAPFVVKSSRSILTLAFLASSAIFIVSLVATIPVFAGHVIESTYWYVDAFAALMVLLIGFIQWTASMTSMHYLAEEEREGVVGVPAMRRYFFLMGLFVFSMLLTVVSNNLGFMWIALEATTLATTLLVAFYQQKGSLEAAWKYLILCSTGISLGLIGLLLTYYAASSTGLLEGLHATNWTDLMAIAPSLSPEFLRIAFIFILIGYGTKVGLVPMHAWLPDAHSRAPSPISGMLSGILLNTALFAILRFKVLVDGALGSSAWTGELLLVFGALSCAIPAAFILLQKDYKRLLAYSSIEHMGIIVFSFGLGAVGAFAAVIHMVGHALAKSALFFAAGNILLRFKSTKFERVGGVMRTLPYTGGLFLALLLALLAVPPSPIFGSELLIVSQSIVNHPWWTLVIVFSLALVFAGFVRSCMAMLFAPNMAKRDDVSVGEQWNHTHTAIVLHLFFILAFTGFLIMPESRAIIENITYAIF